MRCALALAALLAVVQNVPPAVFRSGSTIVSVDVSVNAGQRPVGGLQASDFVLLDNGARQQIEAVGRATFPIDLTLVVDVSGSTTRDLPRYRAAVAEIASFLRPTDRVRLLACGTAVHEVFPLLPPASTLPLDRLVAGGLTRLNDALVVALAVDGDAARRRLIVVFSDGQDTFSVVTGRKLQEVARRADAVMYLVLTPQSGFPGIATPTAARSQARAPQSLLEVMAGDSVAATIAAAEATGGARLSASRGASFAGAAKRVLEDFRSGYVLRYQPTHADAAGWHDIMVGIARSGRYEVRARRGYFVPTAAAK